MFDKGSVMTKIESIVDYTMRADYDSLSDLSKEQLPVHILDSLGCQIAALGAGPVNACRKVVETMAPSGKYLLIGGGNQRLLMPLFGTPYWFVM